MRRGFDAATFRGQPRAFLFNLPATQTPVAKQIYRAELERLGRFLLEFGGSVPTPEILRREMLQAGEARQRLLESPSAPPGNQVPLALVGGPLSATDGNLINAIEAAGGRVVLNAAENGKRSLCPQFDLDAEGDPFDALVNGYFDNIADVFQRPNTLLYSWLKPRLESRQVRGIVLWLLPAAICGARRCKPCGKLLDCRFCCSKPAQNQAIRHAISTVFKLLWKR